MFLDIHRKECLAFAGDKMNSRGEWVGGMGGLKCTISTLSLLICTMKQHLEVDSVLPD